MIRRSTWIFLVVFVVLLAVIIYLQRSEEVAGTSATPTTGLTYLLDVNEAAVTGLEVQDAQGQRVALVREAAGDWTLSEPAAEATDAGVVDSALVSLTSATIMSTLENPPALEDAGLEPPAYTVTLQKDAGETDVIQVGKQTVIGTGYYASVNGGPVQIVRNFSLDPVLKLVSEPPILVIPTDAPSAIPVETQAP
jgi:hypothetical protein